MMGRTQAALWLLQMYSEDTWSWVTCTESHFVWALISIPAPNQTDALYYKTG